MGASFRDLTGRAVHERLGFTAGHGLVRLSDMNAAFFDAREWLR